MWEGRRARERAPRRVPSGKRGARQQGEATAACQKGHGPQHVTAGCWRDGEQRGRRMPRPLREGPWCLTKPSTVSPCGPAVTFQDVRTCVLTDLHADVCSGLIRDYRTRAATGRPSVADGRPGSIRAVGFYSAPERREPRSQERRGGTFDPGYCVKEASLERPPPGSSQPSGLLGKAGPGSR